MKKFSFKIKNQNTGSLLLISVLIMSMVLVVSTATATLIIQGISHNRYLNYGITAGYAAESGLEESLYAIRKQTVAVDQLSATSTLPNNSQFILHTSTSEPYILTSLSQNKSLGIDLGNFDDLSQTQPIKYLCFHWSNKLDSRLVVDWTSWRQDGGINPVCSSGEISPLAEFGGGGGFETYWDCELLGVFSEATGQCSLAPTSSLSYKVNLTALADDVNDLMVIAFTETPDIINLNGLNNPNQADIPNRLFLRSTGRYPADASDRAEQLMTVSGPLYQSNAALYNFVLFSQEPIVK